MTDRPIRVFTLRGVDGAGGGADKIILRTAVSAPDVGIQMQVCFMRHRRDEYFDLDRRSRELGLNYAQVLHRGPFDRSVLPQLIDQVARFEPDLIHSHDYKANFFATQISRKTGLPRVSTSHGWTGHGMRERWLYYPADKWLLRWFDARIGVSTEICEQLLKRGAPVDSTHLLLNGVDPDSYQTDASVRQEVRSQLGFDDEHFVLGAVGRVEKQKRFDLLLEAFAQVRAQIPNARLVIAGDGSLLAELRRQAVHQKLSPYVQIMGHVADMKLLYQSFDRLVQSSDYEGTPTVVVEAMAMKIPVIATDAGGTSQLITNDAEGWIVPIGDPGALAAAIVSSTRCPDEVTKRVERARHRVEHELTFDHRTQRLKAIYDTMLT